MEQSKLTSEWIQTFNRLGSEGKLKPTVPYHDLFNRKELKGFPLHTLPMWTVNFPTGHVICPVGKFTVHMGNVCNGKAFICVGLNIS